MPRQLKQEPISYALRHQRKKYAAMLSDLAAEFEFETSGMNTMSKRVLRNYGITTKKKLSELTDEQIKKFYSCGKKCFKMITEKRDSLCK